MTINAGIMTHVRKKAQRRRKLRLIPRQDFLFPCFRPFFSNLIAFMECCRFTLFFMEYDLFIKLFIKIDIRNVT